MTILSGLLIFIIGAGLGFIANKFFSASSQNQQKLAEKVSHSETALEQYKLDVAEHLDSSAKLLEQMNSTCKVAMEQMAQSTKLLQQATPEESTAMPFFSKETQEQLAQTVALRHKREEKTETSQITEPPLDYSGEASGLFDDSKQAVTNTDTSN
jgi:uncharacterized membrane-anchored protein YhcB (DUF1043 family)